MNWETLAENNTPRFVRNREYNGFATRYRQILFGENTPNDSCPFDDLCCEECKMFSEKHGCSLAYKEGGK